jgi:hypothetical protein
MTAIARYIEKAGLGAVFDDSATKVMGEAFDAACKDLHDTGQPSIVYEVVATQSSKLQNLASAIPRS